MRIDGFGTMWTNLQAREQCSVFNNQLDAVIDDFQYIRVVDNGNTTTVDASSAAASPDRAAACTTLIDGAALPSSCRAASLTLLIQSVLDAASDLVWGAINNTLEAALVSTGGRDVLAGDAITEQLAREMLMLKLWPVLTDRKDSLALSTATGACTVWLRQVTDDALPILTDSRLSSKATNKMAADSLLTLCNTAWFKSAFGGSLLIQLGVWHALRYGSKVDLDKSARLLKVQGGGSIPYSEKHHLDDTAPAEGTTGHAHGLLCDIAVVSNNKAAQNAGLVVKRPWRRAESLLPSSQLTWSSDGALPVIDALQAGNRQSCTCMENGHKRQSVEGPSVRSTLAVSVAGSVQPSEPGHGQPSDTQSERNKEWMNWLSTFLLCLAISLWKNDIPNRDPLQYEPLPLHAPALEGTAQEPVQPRQAVTEQSHAQSPKTSSVKSITQNSTQKEEVPQSVTKQVASPQATAPDTQPAADAATGVESHATASRAPETPVTKPAPQFTQPGSNKEGKAKDTEKQSDNAASPNSRRVSVPSSMKPQPEQQQQPIKGQAAASPAVVGVNPGGAGALPAESSQSNAHGVQGAQLPSQQRIKADTLPQERARTLDAPAGSAGTSEPRSGQHKHGVGKPAQLENVPAVQPKDDAQDMPVGPVLSGNIFVQEEEEEHHAAELPNGHTGESGATGWTEVTSRQEAKSAEASKTPHGPGSAGLSLGSGIDRHTSTPGGRASMTGASGSRATKKDPRKH